MEYNILKHTPKIKLYPKKYLSIKGQKVLCPYGYTEDQILKTTLDSGYNLAGLF